MILGAVVGSTAVGKSHFSITLAKELGCEIISADSRQVYRGFRIGTGQVDTLEMSGVKHHLLDFLSADKQYNAKKFVDDVHSLMARYPEKKFLVVGGTGLYIKSLIEGVSDAPPSDLSIRSRLNREADKIGVLPLYERLQCVDPVAATQYHVNDQLRIVRALEVFEITGEPFSAFKNNKIGGIGVIPVIWLSMERYLLYERINTRVDAMFQQGWVEEVKSLYSHYGTSELPGFKSIGYCQIVGVGEAGVSESLIELIKKETRNYAKRQITFFKNQFSSIILNPLEPNSQKKAIEFISTKI